MTCQPATCSTSEVPSCCCLSVPPVHWAAPETDLPVIFAATASFACWLCRWQSLLLTCKLTRLMTSEGASVMPQSGLPCDVPVGCSLRRPIAFSVTASSCLLFKYSV